MHYIHEKSVCVIPHKKIHARRACLRRRNIYKGKGRRRKRPAPAAAATSKQNQAKCILLPRFFFK